MMGYLGTPDPTRPGPSWKITAARKDRIVNSIRANAFDYEAAQAAGISHATFIQYRNRGLELLDALHADPAWTDDLAADLEEAELNRVGINQDPASPDYGQPLTRPKSVIRII